MANVEGTFYSATTQRRGVTPVSPPNSVDDPVSPVNPPIGSHSPVTIGTPANGLSIVPSSQVLSIGLASSGVTGALSGSDWDTFNGKLNLTSPITGYTVGTNTALAATDNILQAFGKVQGQINARVSGTGVLGQVAFFNGTGSVAGSTGLTWDNISGLFTVAGSISLAARNSYFTSSHNVQIYRSLINASPVYPFSTAGNLVLQSRSSANNDIVFVTGLTPNWRWSILSTGILQSNGAQTIQTSTGNLTLATAAGNGNIILSPNGTGLVMIGSGTPTNLLDVNGTARIRTINNLGTAATSVLVPSATGVVSLRTLAELASDMGVSTDSVQTVSTSGTINDLAITGTTVIFTGASVILNGMSALANSREISLINFTGSNLSIVLESSGSLANNRFKSSYTVLNGQTVRFKYLTTDNRWYLVSGFFYGISDGLQTQVRIGLGRQALSNATLTSRASTSDNTQSALYLDNSSGTRLFSAAANGLIDIIGQAAIGGPTTVPLTTYSLFVQSKGNTSSQGTIYLQNTSGSLLTVWDGAGDQRSVGGATFGVQRVPTGRVEIRGKGTSTASTLSLEDSGGTLNASFLDNGQIRFLRLPTSSAGLAAGSIWNNGGVLNIV